MIVDAHQHFWNYDPIRDAWIDVSMQVIRRDFLPSDLAPILAANNVDACIAVQADQSIKETDFLLHSAANNDFVAGVVGWLDLCSDELEESLDHYSKNKYLKGLRHIVQAEKNDFLLRKDFQNGIRQIGQHGLTYDLLVFPQQLEAAVTLVKDFPDQQFILDHIAKPKVSDGVDVKWKQDIQSLAECENVYCKVSGMVTEAHDYNWDIHTFTPFLDEIVASFGVDRLMYGSDWPVCLLAAEYTEVIHIVSKYFEHFSEDEKAKVFGGNAIEVYNLEKEISS